MKVQDSKKSSHQHGLSDKLEVTVIPVDDEPYTKIITIPNSMMGKFYLEIWSIFKVI